MKQEPKIVMGDLVLSAGREAIVVGSYNDLCCGREECKDKEFSIILCEDGSRSAWHDENQLTFIRRATREDVLKAREARRNRR